MKIGPSTDLAADYGPLVTKDAVNRVKNYIDIGVKEGATLAVDGRGFKMQGYEKGFYIGSSLFDHVKPDMRIYKEEIFGPVVTITPFDTEDEVLAYANSVRYGLSATVWTENLSRAHRLSSNLETGIVWVNCWLLRDLRTPFGGVKDSGIGREGGFEALRFFTEEKNVCVKI